MRWWPRRSEPEPDSSLVDDEVTVRLSRLAAHWQRDLGVRVWEDLFCDDGSPPAGEALAGPTQLLPTAGVQLTPVQRWRGRGGGWW